MTPTEIRELTEALRREIAALPPENEDSRSENATLRAENSELRAEVAALRRRLDPDSSTNSKPFYDRSAFAGSSSALPPAPAISISSADAPVMWYNELPGALDPRAVGLERVEPGGPAAPFRNIGGGPRWVPITRERLSSKTPSGAWGAELGAAAE